MGKIKIFTDSTSDLSKEIIEENNISIVPLGVIFGDDLYKDGENITTVELYKKVGELKQLPKTNAPAPGDFHKAFEPFVNDGCDIVYISLSSHLSATYQNALLAKDMFPQGRINVVDSGNLSTGIGILVLKAVGFANQGLSALEIVDKITALVPKVRTEFVIDTLEYLHKGGRCSTVQKFAGGLLKIQPAVKVIEGKMQPSQKFRGKRIKALNGIISTILKDKGNLDLDYVLIPQSLAKEGAQYVVEKVQQELPEIKQIITTEAGCVISSHCGPNTVGLSYIVK